MSALDDFIFLLLRLPPNFYYCAFSFLKCNTVGLLTDEYHMSAEEAVEIAVDCIHDIREQVGKMQTLQNQRQRLRVQLDRFPSLFERVSSLPLAVDKGAGEGTNLSDTTRAQIWCEIEKTLAESRDSVTRIIAPGVIEQIRKNGVDVDTFESVLRHIASIETSLDNAVKLYHQHNVNNLAASEATLESESERSVKGSLAELVKDVARLAVALGTAEKQALEDNRLMSERLCDILQVIQMRVGTLEEKSNSTARALEKTRLFPIPEHNVSKHIDKGGFGKVFQGMRQPYGTHTTNKVINRSGRNQLQSFDVPFEHVVCYYQASRDESERDLVTKLMKEGSLQQVICSKNPFSWSERYKLAEQCARAVAYLHSRNIVHSDIKSANFLISHECDDNNVVRASTSDLTVITGVLKGDSWGGTLSWTAPERLPLEGPGFGESTFKTDVYSFGVMLWELATRAVPYEGYRNDEFIELVKAGMLLPIPKETPPAFAQLIEDCWAQDASMRPTMQEVLDRLTSLDDQNAPAPAPLPSPAPPPLPQASPAHNSENGLGSGGPTTDPSKGSDDAKVPHGGHSS